MMARIALAIALVLAASACEGAPDPRPQWIVTLHTDAPVPQLGDRVLIEVLDSSGTLACGGCRRLFGPRGPAEWPLSFGIPRGVAAARMRVRLFRSDHSDAGGSPAGDLVLDDLSTLEATSGDVVQRVDRVLWAACAGVAADPAAGTTCEPATRARVAQTAAPVALAPAASSFAPAQVGRCSRAPENGMVCIPGGLFARGSSLLLELEEPLVPERLVQLSPFAIDAHEMTVREMRALVTTGKVEPPGDSTVDAACTYTSAPSERDAHPVSCVSRESAARACAARGKRLPTDAEWEFVAGNRDGETRYPWGEDTDICRHAVVGRGRLPAVEGLSRFGDLSSACRIAAGAERLPWGPAPVEESEDVTALGVHDLGGNLAEWVADDPYGYADDCIAGPPILLDPRCKHVETRSYGLVRGGSWDDYPIRAESARRLQASVKGSPFIGFRCAESM